MCLIIICLTFPYNYLLKNFKLIDQLFRIYGSWRLAQLYPTSILFTIFQSHNLYIYSSANIYFRLVYSANILPMFLIDMLDETPLCPCGRLCLTSQIYEKAVAISIRCQNFISNGSATGLIADSVFCSKRCYSKFR